MQTRVLAGTEESIRPLRRAGDAQEALEMVTGAGLEDTLAKKMTKRIAFMLMKCSLHVISYSDKTHSSR